MKPWLRILAAAAAALAFAGPLAAQSQLAPTGVTITPQSVAPNDTVVVTVLVANRDPSAAVPAGSSVSGKVTLRHRVSGYSFEIQGPFSSSSSVAAAGAVGSFTSQFRIPVTGAVQSGLYDSTAVSYTHLRAHET